MLRFGAREIAGYRALGSRRVDAFRWHYVLMATATHQDPVWRDRADFLIAADISANSDSAQWEQLWARRINEATFEIFCIPFFVYDLALGDVVSTESSGDNEHVVDSVLQPSGRFVFRVWFENATDQAPIVSALVDIGAFG
jgi:hypothetical protein